jgi:hypothetical protein
MSDRVSDLSKIQAPRTVAAVRPPFPVRDSRGTPSAALRRTKYFLIMLPKYPNPGGVDGADDESRKHVRNRTERTGLKHNKTMPHADIQLFLNDPVTTDIRSARTVDGGPGRIENRTAMLSAQIA